jgi:hypothetical protein
VPQRRSPSSTAFCKLSPADPFGCQRRPRGRDAVGVSPDHQKEAGPGGGRFAPYVRVHPLAGVHRWPEFAVTAARVSIAGLAKIPTSLDDQIIVAFNIYSAEPRQWSDEAITVARVLANLATSYVLNASKLRQQEQLSEKLQKALDSRVIIEQAKRITAYQRAVTVDQAY